MANHRIFKFRAANPQDLDALFENYIWFASLSSLNDPYEGCAAFSNEGIDDNLRIKFLEYIYSQKPTPGIIPKDEVLDYYHNYEKETGTSFSDFVDSRTKGIFKDFYNTHRNDYAIFSFSLAKDKHNYPSPLNNMLMWAHYANGFRGYCVEFDFDKLFDSVKEKNDIDLGSANVKYSKNGKLPIVPLKEFMLDQVEEQVNSSRKILDTFFCKEGSWHYENEARLISDKHGKAYYDPKCINKIYISENLPNWARASISEHIKQLNSGIELVEVCLHSTDYKFGFNRVDKL